VTHPSLRTPLRPLSRILPARERGENTDVIERENIRARHEAEKEAVRQRAQGRLLVLGIVFICLYSVIAIRVGTLSASEPVEPRAQTCGCINHCTTC
jgi:cell division protein FtsI (penicillin-binding protein 3)